MNKIKLFSILVLALVMLSCNKDDDNEMPIGEIKGGNITDNHGTVLLQWSAYEGALAYYVFVDGQTLSDIPFTDTQAIITEIQDKDIVEVKAYADSEATQLLASVKISYEEPELVAPEALSNLSVGTPQETSVTINFAYSGTCAGINIYTEERTEESVPLLTIDQVVNGDNTVTIESLESGNDYTLYFYAFNEKDEEYLYSDEATVSFTTPRTIASIQVESTGYVSDNGGALNMKVLIVDADLFSDPTSEWTTQGDLILELYCSESTDGEFRLVSTKDAILPLWEWESSKNVDLYAYNYKLFNDYGEEYENGETYYLQAIAKNKEGEIIGKTEVHEATYEEPISEKIVPSKPENVTLTLNGSCVSIRWSEATDALAYKVIVSSSESMNYESEVKTTTSTSAEDCNRGKNVRMYYQVIAISSTGHKAYSSVKSIWL